MQRQLQDDRREAKHASAASYSHLNKKHFPGLIPFQAARDELAARSGPTFVSLPELARLILKNATADAFGLE